MQRPKYLNEVIRLRSDRYANYLTYYHNQSDSDKFYIVLNKIVNDHKKHTNAGDIFKSPISQEGFYFKVDSRAKCLTKHKSPCIINELVESDVYCRFKIYPYDFTKDGVRIVGVSITLMSAVGNFDKS
jgi:hypothetical protein